MLHNTEFLEKRSKDHLQLIIAVAGLSARIGTGSGLKKSDLVAALAKAFREAKTGDEAEEADRGMRDCLTSAPLGQIEGIA